MNNLNSILLEGTLTDDPAMHTTQQGTPICTFTLASSRYVKREDCLEKEVSFFNVEVSGELAEKITKTPKKGHNCRVVGRIVQERTASASGKNEERFFIAAEHIEFHPTDNSAKTE